MTTNDLSLTITRTFTTLPENVFSAWTDPAGLRFWWFPAGTNVESVQIDLHVGGHYQIVNKAPSGNGPTFVVSGSYQEIKAPQRLVYTWTWQEGDDNLLANNTLVTVDLKGMDTRTQFTLIHQGFEDKVGRDRHLEGWENALDGFETYLSTLLSDKV